MLTRLLFLILLLPICAAHANLLGNLSSRITAMPNHPGSLIKSFSHHTQSYVYDQALAIIAFSQAKNQKTAEALLDGLNSLQQKDGSLYFSYYLDGKSPYPTEGDKRFAGALAWVALSVNHYQQAFASKKYENFQNKLLGYLQQELRSVSINGKSVLGLKFNPSDVPETVWQENETTALEHNLDLYAAFSFHARLNGKDLWSTEIAGLKGFILSMWDHSRNHFWSGASLKTGAINQEEIYLDNQTWSMLALDNQTVKGLKLKSALAMNCDDLFVKHEGVMGFMDRKPLRAPAFAGFVWSEGSLGQILAMKKSNEELSCQGHKSHDLLKSIQKMKQADGGIAYSTTTSNPDFTTSSSVAGTAWLYFAELDFNPFAPSES